MIICITGPDGAGKSSVIREIAREECTFWMRGGHGLAFLILKIMERWGKFGEDCTPNFRVCIPPPLSRVWWLIEFTSYLALFILRVLWKKIRRCKLIVVDRCPLDLAAWIYSISSYLPWWLFLVLISLSKSLNAVVLCAPREVLAKRKPEELRPKTLKFYESLCKSGIIKTVDTSKPLEEVVSEVVRQIDDRLLRPLGGGEELGH